MNRSILVSMCGLVTGGLLVPSCGGEATEVPQEALSEERADVVEDVGEARQLLMREYLGEARDASTRKGDACRIYCATSYAAACWRVTQLCAGAEVITIGGSTVACAVAIPAVCLTSVAIAQVCSGQCPP